MTLQIFTVKNLVVKMNDKELECFKHFLEAYKNQWDLNRYARDQYDEDLEYYCSYRPAERYPLLYNESFNKLLPRIFTVMARFMDQLYQAGTGNLISVKPRKKSDVDRAPRIEGLLNYQLETLNDIDMQGGSYLFNFQWMFNALSWGKGIAKVYWRKEERIAPRRIDVPIPVFDDYGRLEGIENKTIIVKDMQTVYDGPYAEVLHNKLFVPHPFYKNIQKMPFCFCVYKKSINDLKVMQEAGIYKNIKNLGWGSPKSGDASLDSYEAFAKSIEIMGVSAEDCFSSSRSAPMVDVIEGYGKYIFPEDDTAYEVGSGVKIKGKESEAIVHIGNYKTLLSIQKNEYGIRPFFDIGCYYHPELYWDTGIISLGKGIQEQYNTLANTRFQNAIMLVNQMLKVNVDADIPPEALQWKPHGIIPVESMDDVQPLVQPDASQSYAFREQENFFDETLQEMTGVYAYNMGATPDRQERVGTIHCLKSDSYEILTSEGWKTFQEIGDKEVVMTLNHESGEMEWHSIIEKVEFEEKEYELFHFKTASSEFYCTGEHRIPVEMEGRNGFNKKIVRANELSECSHAKIPLTGKWSGVEFTPPFEGISARDWMAFMGLYLSEGHFQHNVKNWCYRVGISQENERKSVVINELLTRTPWKWWYSGHQWIVNNKALYEYLGQFGKSWEKYIPDEIKNASPELLEVFFQWYHLGDGHINNGGQRCITTASCQMADDLQEIILKLGSRAHIWFEKRKEDHHHDKYHITESSDKYTWWYHNGHKAVTVEKHFCRVSCVTVPNGIFMIRSIDYKKPVWTGNSLQAMGDARSKLLLMTMDHTGFRPFLKYMMTLNTFHMTADFEAKISSNMGDEYTKLLSGDFHVDYDFSARYTGMEPALGKMYRAEKLLQLAAMWKDSPYLQHFQWNKAIMELMDFQNTDKYLKTPEQLKQEQQQAMQQQMMGLMMQDQLEANKQRRQLESDTIKALAK